MIFGRNTITVIFVLCLLWPAGINAASFGYDGTASFSMNVENKVLATLDAPDSTGNLDSVKIYLYIQGDTSFSVHASVYKDNDSSLIDVTDTITVSADTGWYWLHFVGNNEVQADTNYFIAGQASRSGTEGNNIQMRFNLSGGAYRYDDDQTFGAWPDPYPYGDFNIHGSRPVRIKAYYTVAAEEEGLVTYRHSPEGVGDRSGGTVRHVKE